MEQIHICNEAAANIPVKESIGCSYEDRNLDNMAAAEALVEFVGKHAPGQFVNVHTGDYVHSSCYHPECEIYDPVYWHYLVPKSVWEQCEESVMRIDREWRQKWSSCQRDVAK